MSPDASFRAMGVDVVVGGASDAELALIRRCFAEWDARFSRFRAGSELNAVNGAAAATVVVSTPFARALRASLAAARTTGGLVDPTVGAALAAAGYDRDFDALPADGDPAGAAAPGSWRALRVTGRVLSRPPGTVLDLNGVVKALAVDEALTVLGGAGFVSAGGDLTARGGAYVALPAGGAVRLRCGGLATTGTTVRRWKRGGVDQHHLIDPRTGRPARSAWTQVTVAAGSCLAADVAGRAAFLLSAEGPDWLDQRGLPGRFLAGAVVVTNRAWRRAIPEDALAGSLR